MDWISLILFQVRNGLELPCEESVQCKGTNNSVCSDFKCQCQYNHQQFEGDCYLPVKLGDHCTNTNECILGVSEFAVCNSIQLCECKPNTIEYYESCWEAKMVGDSCKSSEECQVSILGMVQCADGNCACINGQKPDLNGHACSSAWCLQTFSNFLFISFHVARLVLPFQ